jgi:hypothetical protein
MWDCSRPHGQILDRKNNKNKKTACIVEGAVWILTLDMTILTGENRSPMSLMSKGHMGRVDLYVCITEL